MPRTSIPEVVQSQTYNTAQLACVMGVSEVTALNMMRNGDVPRVSFGKGSYLVPIKALDAYFDELGRLAARDYAKREDEKWMDKFKVGDRVRIRCDMEANKNYGGLTLWKGDMSRQVGKTITICGTTSEKNYLCKENCYAWAEEMLEALPDFPKVTYPKIVITTDGVTTWAREYDGKKVLKEEKVSCYFKDTFDFEEGARQATKKLLGVAREKEESKPSTDAWSAELYCVKSFMPGEYLTRGKKYRTRINSGIQLAYDDGCVGCAYSSLEDYKNCNVVWYDCLYPLVQRHAKPGEWVLVVKASGTGDRYKNGDIMKIIDDPIHGNYHAHYGTNGGWYMEDSEYLVLDGYDGRYEQKEPEA